MRAGLCCVKAWNSATTPAADSAGVVEDVERSRILWPVCRHGELERHERPALSVRGLVITEVDQRRLAGNLLVNGADELINRRRIAARKW
jgi:hypothetical protein